MQQRKRTCTVMGCEDERPLNDTLFCRSCRLDWKSFCELNGIDEGDARRDIIENMLVIFQNDNMKKKKRF